MSRLLRGSEILGILITWLLFGGMTLGQSEGKGKVTWEEYWKLEARLGAGTEKPMESIDLGGQRQLFVDNYVVEHLENVKKVLHQPDKHLDNPILRPERPWEERNRMGQRHPGCGGRHLQNLVSHRRRSCLCYVSGMP